MKFFEIIHHKPIHKDDRGNIYSHSPEQIVKELITIKRNKGAISGNHYHKGIDKSKNPERFIMLNGRARLMLKHLKTEQQAEKIIASGDEVIIYPFVHHTIEIIEDNTIFIELKREKDNYNDVFR